MNFPYGSRAQGHFAIGTSGEWAIAASGTFMSYYCFEPIAAPRAPNDYRSRAAFVTPYWRGMKAPGAGGM